MASGATLEKMQQLYAKAEAAVKEWAALQERMLSLLGTLANIAARLPALEDPGAYGALAALPAPNFPQRLLAAQLAAVEQLLAELQGVLEGMQAAAGELERQANQAQRFVQQNRSLTPAACAVAVGPVPSVNQCIEGLRDIWRMHADELQLKCALVREVRFNSSEQELRHVRALCAAQPYLSPGRAQDLLYAVAATRDPRRL